MTSQVYVVGIGMTPFGKHLDQTIKGLTASATSMALKDAGCTGKEVQAAFFANSTQGHMEGQDMIRGQITASLQMWRMPFVIWLLLLRNGSPVLSLRSMVD